MPDRLLRRDPTPESYSAQPFTALEIDSHPDHARIWATIRQVREEMVSFRTDYDTRTRRG